MFQLLINGPGYFDTAFQLNEGTTSLGRAEQNDIVLSGDLVSRRHALLRCERGNLTVEDVGSRNGTKLNGAAVTTAVPVVAGDVLTFGENTVAVQRVGGEKADQTGKIHLSGDLAVQDAAPEKEARLLGDDMRESGLMRALDNISPIPMATFEEGDPAHRPQNRRVLSSYETLELVSRTAELLMQATSLQGFVDEAVERVFEGAGASTVALLLRGPKGALRVASLRHHAPLGRGEVPVVQSIVAESLQTGSAVVVPDLSRDSRGSGNAPHSPPEQIICAPIGARSPAEGAIYLSLRGHSSAGLTNLKGLTRSIANLISAALARFGIAGRHSPEARLRASLERAYAPEVAEQAFREALGATTPPFSLASVDAVVLEARFTVPAAPSGEQLALIEAFVHRAPGLVFSFDGAVELIRPGLLRAVFGLPARRPDDAHRAVRTAVALQADWQQQCGRVGRVQTALRVGVSSGPLLTGHLRTAHGAEFTVLGEPVSRAEALVAQAGGDTPFVDQQTAAALAGRFKIDPAGEVLVNGARAPMFRVQEEAGEAFTNPGDRGLRL